MSQLSLPQLFFSGISSPQIASTSPNRFTSRLMDDEVWWGYPTSLVATDDGLSEMKMQSRISSYGSEYLSSGTMDTVDPRLLTRSSSSRDAGENIEVLGDPLDEIQSWKGVNSGEMRIGDLEFVRLTGSRSHVSAAGFREGDFQEKQGYSMDENSSYVIEKPRYLLRRRQHKDSLNISTNLQPERVSRQSTFSPSSSSSFAVPEALHQKQRVLSGPPIAAIDVPLHFDSSPQSSYSFPINPSFIPSPPDSVTRSPSPPLHINPKNRLPPNKADIITPDLVDDSKELIVIRLSSSSLSPPPTDFERRTPQSARVHNSFTMSTSPGLLPLTESLPGNRGMSINRTPARGKKRKHAEGRQENEGIEQPRNRRSARHKISHDQVLSSANRGN
jgi:hypothetical protein